ncbi:uncharacterized protein BDV17DRAFT_249440 [Aspergillus undulatus]|uniref:uncharacterized protein n=1 Tax=Aspergillus undulatus TaxID=1810928 RepID=UPI003CCE34B3
MSASVLGESWVVASVTEEQDAVTKNVPTTPKQARPVTDGGSNHGSAASSMSGPELIMPSIYETPVTEASWVAPTVRTKQASPTLRRRHQSSAEPAKTEKPEPPSETSTQSAHSTTTPNHQTQTRFAFLETPIRTIANVILLAAILHLLILPELVQQYQNMCSIGPISILYPSSCVSRYHQSFSPHTNSQSIPAEAILTSQTRLEYVFNATLQEMAPLNSSLKQTESQLRIVERELKRAHPGTKHELDLEFESCWRAIRIAAWKFDSLKVDLQSAVDSLVAAGDVKPISTPSDARSSVAHDARISTQMLRRENYIAQLMARMRSKADSLAADLATLDDHLESIEGIVDREIKHSGSSATYQSSRDSSSRLVAFVDALIPPSVSLPSFLRPHGHGHGQADKNDTSNSSSPELTLSQIFHAATTHHRPVAGLARNLSRNLQQK